MSAKNLRVLVVDDNDDAQVLARFVLEDHGYHVTSSDCIEAAVVAAGNAPFDLFICDMRLPDGNGIELREQLYQIQPEVPALFYSGIDWGDDVTSTHAHDRTMVKPACIEDLAVMVNDILRPNQACC